MIVLLLLSLWLNIGCIILMYINAKHEDASGVEINGGPLELLEMALTFPAVMLTYLIVWIVK